MFIINFCKLNQLKDHMNYIKNLKGMNLSIFLLCLMSITEQVEDRAFVSDVR